MIFVKYALLLSLLSACVSFASNGMPRTLPEVLEKDYENKGNFSDSIIKNIEVTLGKSPFDAIKNLLETYLSLENINLSEGDRVYLSSIEQLNKCRSYEFDELAKSKSISKSLTVEHQKYSNVLRTALSHYLTVLSPSVEEFEYRKSIIEINKISKGFQEEEACRKHSFSTDKQFSLGHKANHQFVLYTLEYLLSNKFPVADSSQ